MISNTQIADLLQNITIEDAPYVGNSIALLGHLVSEKLPIPGGFVLSYFVLQRFFDLTEIGLYYQKARLEEDSSHIFQVIRNTSFPKEIRDNISALYSKISGFSDATVSIRALILDDKSEELQHKPYEVYGIRGTESLIKAIHDIYIQILEDHQTKLSLFFDNVYKVVVIVQKLIQCEISGHVYTSEIVTHDNTKLHIDAYFGLYEEAEKLGLQPDLYIYDKISDKIEEKHISRQEYMLIRQQNSSEPIQKVDISPSWQKKQKLDDKYIIVLAKTGKIIEEELASPQHIIWSYEAGKIWIHFVENINKKQSIDSSHYVKKRVHLTLTNQTLQNQNSLNPLDTKKEHKNVLVDFVFNDKNMNDSINVKMAYFDNNNTNPDNTYDRKEVLLEGKHSAGTHEVSGIATLSHETAQPHNILILRGDESISSGLKVAGFIIEEDSEILADRLYEYFKVPVITGVPLVHKIIKEGEKISIDPTTHKIYEFIKTDAKKEYPDAFSKNSDKHSAGIEETKSATHSGIGFTNNIDQNETNVVHDTQHTFQSYDNSNQYNSINFGISPAYIRNERYDSKDQAMTQTPTAKIQKQENNTNTLLYEDSKVRIERKHPLKYPYNPKVAATPKKDLSQLLNLIDEDIDLYGIGTEKPQNSIVEGISEKDQMKLWGKSLEQIINSSKEVPTGVALEVLEETIQASNTIQQTSKELEFDREENYISQKMQHNKKQASQPEEFIPTATKVYVHLIDELIDQNKQNYDGVVFSSSKEPDIMLDMVETILDRIQDKEILLICPPYETKALDYLLQEIHRLRNQGYRNLSLITPDYRNKSSLIEFKKRITFAGLKRSSSFRVFANVSKTINVFRLQELNTDFIDGVYIDLFRIKMNMLGIEKDTASTRYVEGMKNLVKYISETLELKNRCLIDISGFRSPKKVVDHVSKFGFWGIACEQSVAHEVKQYIKYLEMSQLK